jgi:hypothetical protein
MSTPLFKVEPKDVEQNKDQQIKEELNTNIDMVMTDSLRDVTNIQSLGAKIFSIKNLVRNKYVYLQNKNPSLDSIFISFSF